ncbi:AraC family transcriptional regulator [Nocardia aurantia]|uniref:HTH-type transcriptional activator RhaR n=1 Tax=Nocardia aurantia TaxID=2585199 RepID=A0A7K0DSK9_9NOCA|nr:helix-turn-helix transcriptional regulator [Nocardia aurantia]MQY27814.1 HTH-type transcriptional activator RhaR [Nocardia aurantia]
MVTGTAASAESLLAAADSRFVRLRGASAVLAGSYTFTGTVADAGWHRHDLHQLEYAVAGVIEVETPVARYRSPSRQAVWIPAGLAHRSILREVHTVSVFFDPVLLRDNDCRARVLHAGPLLREMVIHAGRWPIDRPATEAGGESYFEALAHLVLEWLGDEQPFHLPVGRDPLTAEIMRWTDANLASATLPQVCRAVAVSERTLRRRFHAATGMTWQQYLRQSRLLHATTLLVETTDTVMSIATAVGFDSAAAFTRAFERYSGRTPSAFRRERR